jgi:hypothetical protein
MIFRGHIKWAGAEQWSREIALHDGCTDVSAALKAKPLKTRGSQGLSSLVAGIGFEPMTFRL